MPGRLELSDSFKKEGSYSDIAEEIRVTAKVSLLTLHPIQGGVSTTEGAERVGYSRQVIWKWLL